MSSKIEVPRELIEWIFGCTVRSFFLERHDKLKELKALLAAPVVERQPDAWRYAVNGMWEWCADREHAVHELALFHAGGSAEELAELKADGLHAPQALYVDPPELAELQATIARLTAENERLKRDHQHMVDRNALLRQRPDLPVDRLPAHKRLEELQASQPAPVSVDMIVLLRKSRDNLYLHAMDYKHPGQYNLIDKIDACLDKVKELNQ